MAHSGTSLCLAPKPPVNCSKLQRVPAMGPHEVTISVASLPGAFCKRLLYPQA